MCSGALRDGPPLRAADMADATAKKLIPTNRVTVWKSAQVQGKKGSSRRAVLFGLLGSFLIETT